MKFLLGVVFLAAAVFADEVVVVNQLTSAYNYHANYGVKEAARIAKEEKAINDPSRIAGGSQASINQFPYQAGLLVALDIGTSVCGGALISNRRVLTAAHCWFDGVNQASNLEVVLGSAQLFFGGTRVISTDVQTHEEWNPITLANDIALIVIPAISTSDSINIVALPTDAANQAFANSFAVATGYGRTSDTEPITNAQSLRQLWVQVVTNAECQLTFGGYIRDTNLCTSGSGGVGVCGGDSGGPLTLYWSGTRVLIGINSFFSSEGCQAGLPSAFTRITSYLDWIQARLF